MPIFTFIYGDLHAHMIAMPLIIFAVAFVFNELIVSGRDRRPWWAQAGALAVGAAAVGMSKAVNSWDWPTLMVLCVAGLGFAVWLRSRALNRRFVLGLLMTVGGFVALAGLAVWPYDYWFATSYASFRPWQGPNTPLWAYFTVHGLFLFLIVSLLLWETARWLRSVRVGALRGKWPFLLAFLIAFAIVWLVAFAFVVRGQRVVLVVLPLVAWIAVLFFRPRQSRAMQTVLVLAGLSLCITMGVEFLVLSNDIGRQNTVFKFYIQVWLFLSVAGGAAAAWLVSHSVRWRPALAVPWYAVAAVLVFAAALFPVMATRGKAVQRFNQELPVTLDGMDFMPYASHWELGSDQPIPLSGDYDIIRWLQDNVEGTPVIMEGRSRAEYQWGGRIANYTGLPSVLGWRFHQTQQRTIDSMSTLVNHRGANVNAFYENLDVVSAVNILRYYEVHYIIVGALERARYGPTGGLAKFDLMVEDGMLTEVFRNGDDVIYQVNRDALGSVSASVFIEGGG
jgi:YYY domain-containing protein